MVWEDVEVEVRVENQAIRLNMTVLKDLGDEFG